MRQILASGLSMILIAGLVMGQVQFTIPLTTSIASGLSGPQFANPFAMALLSNGTIHYVTGLGDPSTATYQSLTPPSGQGIVGSWRRLNDSSAVYRSSAGELILVRGLPGNPVLVPTGIPAVSAAFIPWTETLAVQVDASVPEFRVLDHAAAVPTLQSVTSPFGLAAPPTSTVGRQDNWGATKSGAFVGLGPGADALMGTGDDQLVRLTEGAFIPYFVEASDLPAPAAPRGLKFNEAGTAAYWRNGPAETIAVTIIDPAIQPAATFTTIYVTTTALTGPVLLTTLVGGKGDTFRAGIFDDIGLAYCWRFIDDAGTAPVLGASYCDDGQAGTYSIVGEHRGVVYSGMAVGMGPKLYTRFLASGNQTIALPILGCPSDFVQPNPGSLMAFIDNGDVTVVTDLGGSNTLTTLANSGVWGSPTTLTPGKVVCLFTPTGGGADQLAVMTAPGTPVVGESPSHPFAINITPNVPSISAPLHIQGISVDANYAGPATLALSLAQAAPLPFGPPSFAPGSQFHLDLGASFTLIPLPMSSGFGELIFDLSNLPPGLAGTHAFVQIAFLNPAIATWYLSDARLIVIG